MPEYSREELVAELKRRRATGAQPLYDNGQRPRDLVPSHVPYQPSGLQAEPVKEMYDKYGVPEDTQYSRAELVAELKRRRQTK